jgi:7-cyano-7-deazaguanine tRNA-ribosyltransferase
VYPLAQSLFPKITDRETEEETKEFAEEFLKKMGFIDIRHFGDVEPGEIEYDADLLRAKAVARYQFGIEAADELLKGNVELVVSRKTGKIRNVISDGEHVLSMRASDGLYTLRPEGAKRLLKVIPSPKMRAIVMDDAVPYVSNGRNVFCQFVIDMAEELRPMEETIVVDKDDNFLATGRAQLIKSEVKSLKKGIAVRVRSGNDES